MYFFFKLYILRELYIIIIHIFCFFFVIYLWVFREVVLEYNMLGGVLEYR